MQQLRPNKVHVGPKDLVEQRVHLVEGDPRLVRHVSFVVVLYDLTTFTKLGLEELAESSILLPAQEEAVVPIFCLQDLRGASRSLDAVRTASKSKKRPPATSSPGDDS